MSSTHAREAVSFYLESGSDRWKPANKVDHPTTLEGTITGPTLINVGWSTIPGNQPATNGNLLALWQNQGIPPGQKPLDEAPIQNNTPSGDQAFQVELQRKPYVVGYGTSASGTAWAASLQFNPGSVEGKPFVTKIDVNSVGNNFIVADFDTWVGNIPNANKNWIGLWEGPTVTYDGSNRIVKVEVESNVNQAQQQLNGLNLTINTTYSLAYAVGPRDADIAAWQTFTTVPY